MKIGAQRLGSAIPDLPEIFRLSPSFGTAAGAGW